MDKYHDIISKWVLQNISNISFSKFCEYCSDFSQTPVHSMRELKLQIPKNKNTGNIFEYFCKLYLQQVLQYDKVWLLCEVPDDIRKKLSIGTKDMGIDIIAIKEQDTYAIQCKYRKRIKKKTGINWKDLSTFYALVSKTGPYTCNIIMTNADYISRIGKKQNNELLLSFTKFEQMNIEDWRKFIKKDPKDNTNLSITKIQPKTHNEIIQEYQQSKTNINERNQFLREQRLKYFIESNPINEHEHNNNEDNIQPKNELTPAQFLREQRIKHFMPK